MILAAAVLLGFSASLARHRKHTLSSIASIALRSAWLAVLAVVLQWPLLRSPQNTPQDLRVQQALFLSSYGLLLAFVWRNRRQAAILILGIGVLCNLIVVAANDGWMPIAPKTLVRINAGTVLAEWPTGMHYAYSKDIVRAPQETRLAGLSDRLVVPSPFPWPTAFSTGDLFIAVGIVLLLLAPDWVLKRRQRYEE